MGKHVQLICYLALLHFVIGQGQAHALLGIPYTSVDELPRRREELADPDPNIRRQAATALGNMLPRSRAAVPRLALSLQDKSPEVRRAACRALTSLGPHASGAIAQVIEALRDADMEVRFAATRA